MMTVSIAGWRQLCKPESIALSLLKSALKTFPHASNTALMRPAAEIVEVSGYTFGQDKAEVLQQSNALTGI